jgi:hypothetical protein
MDTSKPWCPRVRDLIEKDDALRREVRLRAHDEFGMSEHIAGRCQCLYMCSRRIYANGKNIEHAQHHGSCDELHASHSTIWGLTTDWIAGVMADCQSPSLTSLVPVLPRIESFSWQIV